jgi:hypothetical protein
VPPSAHYLTAQDASAGNLRNTWTDIFRSDTLVHLCLLLSIAAGCFQGYLKDRFAGPVPYLLSDGALLAGAFFWFASLVVFRRGFEGPRRTVAVVLGLVAVPFLYLVLAAAPLPIELAGLRAWSVMPVACLIGMSVVRTPGHVRAYIGWIVLLCVVTAIYGIRQYQIGPAAALSVSDLATERHGSSVFYSLAAAGAREFRAFSTFTFPAPFAGMMVFGMLLVAGAAISRSVAVRWRVLCVLLLPLFFQGMTVSGTRAGLVTLLVGLVVIARFRRLDWRVVVLTAPLLLAAHFASILTSGRAFERFSSVVVREGLLWAYVVGPVSIAWQSLQEAPFGLGLGRTGVGVPYRWAISMPKNFFVWSDGDIGRAAIEMGLVGLLLVGVILFFLLPVAYRSVRTLLDGDRDGEDVAFGVGALVLSTGGLVLIGSPLSSVPHGIVWWFLLGALIKLAMLRHDRGDAASP